MPRLLKNPFHRPDLRRYPDQIAAVEHEALDRRQLGAVLDGGASGGQDPVGLLLARGELAGAGGLVACGVPERGHQR